MKRTPAIVVVLALVCALALVPGAVSAQSVAPEPCGVTTLDATLEIGPDGTMVCAEGEPLTVREELAAAEPGRESRREALTSFLSIADVQLADEESPLRGEWADKCPPDSPVSDSAWRPQETMVPHLMNAHVLSANQIVASGGPVLGQPVEFMVALGDLADNAQLNEIRWIIDIFDGGKIVNPDSGITTGPLDGDGYDGVQAQDPPGGKEIAAPEGERILDLANEPFWAAGLRAGEDPLPWYSLPGNHDVKVQGTIPDNNPAWRNMVRRYAIGHIKLMDLAPDYQARLCDGDPTVFEDILADPTTAGTTKIVPSDPARLPLYRSDEAKAAGDEEACLALTLNDPNCLSSWIEEHFTTTGLPLGHGYATDDANTPVTENGRCTDAEGNPLARACYSFDRGLFHFIALDTNPAEGLESGNIDEPQWAWLQRELQANSTKYFGEDGAEQQNPDGSDRLIVVATHHTIDSTDNTGMPPGSAEARSGEELKELLLRFPNVVVQVDGHTHQNRIWAHENEELGTGYWEVNTSAVADLPTQSRSVEIADNRDGTLSIFAVVFDAFTAPDARLIDWTAHDPTDEVALSNGEATRNINEQWLASFGREVTFYDPQADLTKTGEPQDRNVELLIDAPEWYSQNTTALQYTGPRTAKVGSTIKATARLTSADGTPLSGMTIAFERAGRRDTARTNSDGVATARLKIAGPAGTRPLEISFDGADGFQASSLSVPVTGTAGKGGGDGKKNRSRGLAVGRRSVLELLAAF